METNHAVISIPIPPLILGFERLSMPRVQIVQPSTLVELQALLSVRMKCGHWNSSLDWNHLCWGKKCPNED